MIAITMIAFTAIGLCMMYHRFLIPKSDETMNIYTTNLNREQLRNMHNALRGTLHENEIHGLRRERILSDRAFATKRRNETTEHQTLLGKIGNVDLSLLPNETLREIEVNMPREEK